MALQGKGVLAVWTGIEPEHAADFDHWYVTEHLPERVNNPGFLGGRRYEAVQGGPKSFAYYEAESPEVLASDTYLDILRNPTDWSQRVFPHFRDTRRMVGRVTLTAGNGIGGSVATLRFSAGAGEQAGLRTWLGETAFPALLAHPAVVGAHLFEPDLEVTRRTSRELGFPEPDPDAAPVWAIMVEGTAPERLGDALVGSLNDEGLLAHGAASPAELAYYRLWYALQREHGRSG